MANEVIKNINQIDIDDGLELIEIHNKRGDKIGEFYFSPTDVGIVDRYNTAIQKFEEAILPMLNEDDSAEAPDNPEAFVETLNTIKTTLGNAWENIKTTAATKWANISTTLATAWEGIKTTVGTKWNNLKTTISTAWDNIKTVAGQKWSDIKTSLSTAWEGIKTLASTKWGNLKTAISTAWDNIKTTAGQKWDNIKTSLSTAWEGIKTAASTKWENIKSTIQNKGWSGVGSNIASGIGAGIESGWKWLTNKVSTVASSLLGAAKSALGIHSPSRLFRDTIGLNIGLGIGEGIEDSEQSVVKTVNNVAEAIADEFSQNSYSISPIGVDNNGAFTRSLESFSDKIVNSFTSLLDRLQAIGNSVAFSIPHVAYAAVPHSVTSGVSAGERSHINEAAIDELTDIVIQCFTNSTNTLVRAIESNSGDVNINLDSNSLTTNVIKEINRRTKMLGKTPLLY